MLKKTIVAVVGAGMAAAATNAIGAEPTEEGVKKWQPNTPRVQMKPGGSVMEAPRPGGSVMESPNPGGTVMETPVPGSVNELPVGSSNKIKKRIGPGPVA